MVTAIDQRLLEERRKRGARVLKRVVAMLEAYLQSAGMTGERERQNLARELTRQAAVECGSQSRVVAEFAVRERALELAIGHFQLHAVNSRFRPAPTGNWTGAAEPSMVSGTRMAPARPLVALSWSQLWSGWLSARKSMTTELVISEPSN